jgi:hypothetical protein
MPSNNAKAKNRMGWGMLEAAKQAAKEIEAMKSNKTIMDFVVGEARAKVAEEIRSEMKGGTTAKAVALLEMRYPNIKARVDEYVNIGLIGCLMQKYAA